MGQKLLLVIIAIVVVGGGAWWYKGQGTSAPVAQTGELETLNDTTSVQQETAPRQAAPTAPANTATQQAPKPAPKPATTPTTAPTDTPAPAPVSTPTPTPAAAPAPVVAATVNVSIQSFAFTGGSVTIKKGTKVVWTNNDSAPHTVTSTQGGVPNGTFESGNMNNGAAYSFTFDTPGTYTYICKYHPSMKGTIIVTE